VEWTVGQTTTVLLSTTATFSDFASYIFETFRDIRPTLLYSNMKSLVGFPLIPKYVIVNDLEWLFHVKSCFRVCMSITFCVVFENNRAKTTGGLALRRV